MVKLEALKGKFPKCCLYCVVVLGEKDSQLDCSVLR